MEQQTHLEHSKERKITLTYLRIGSNGLEKQKLTCLAHSHTTLLDLLREKLSYTGAKEACGVGECGACTVILNGKAVRSCLILAFEADGGEIMTIESLSAGDVLHPLQQSFIDHDAVQCGYCIPGFIMAAYNLYQRTPNPTREEVLEAMGGHLCRCTGYHSIYQAISQPSREQK